MEDTDLEELGIELAWEHGEDLEDRTESGEGCVVSSFTLSSVKIVSCPLRETEGDILVPDQLLSCPGDRGLHGPPSNMTTLMGHRPSHPTSLKRCRVAKSGRA